MKLIDNPKLMKEWDWEKNQDLDPNQLLYNSGKKAWWICSKGHKYEQSIVKRTSRGYSCPVCSGHKTLVGYNDLATRAPEIAKEWHPTKNNLLKPSDVTFGSNKKAWWKCSKCGYSWETRITYRTGPDHTGCPYCARQKIMPGYNDLQTEYPKIAKEWHPTKNGNLTPSMVMGGSSRKTWWICSVGHTYQQSIAQRTSRNGSCPYCLGQKVLVGFNDLASNFPKIAQEWHPTKNGNLKPTQISKGSNKKFWWRCTKCRHEWEARVADRTRDLTGCPACANKILIQGFNDLATKFPKVAAEWHPIKNGNLTPKDVKATSNKKVWWICDHKHEYEQAIQLRTTRSSGCPFCAGNKVWKGFNDLATTYPKIAKEWHPTKNGKLTPWNVIAGSQKKVWWLCPEGHEYQQSLIKRTSRDYSCPICSGHKALAGYNDFATKYPQQAREWHPTKNGTLKPSDVTFGSGKKVWWKCPIGHEYQASMHDRGTGGTNCPICGARKFTSFPEQAIFYYIKQVFPDASNRYKKIFDTFMEFDIYIPSVKVAVEYDGANWHRTEAEHKRELKKYALCQKHHVTLIRVKEVSKQTWNNVADKVYYLKKVKRTDFSQLENTISLILNDIKAIGGRSNFSVNINVLKDKNKIQEYLTTIENSLEKERPDVAAKWNYDKNGNLKPNMFSVSSNEKIWWKCPDCGHEWESSINSMTREGRYGCAICAKSHRGKTFTKNKIKQVGSLADTMPDLAKEWHPTKNGTLTPHDIVAGRNKSVWWLCSKCGYEWKALPSNRRKGVGCPCCSGRVPKPGVNDLETRFPKIAKEWCYEKNTPLTPKDVLPGSGKKVWWKCQECGHEWKTEIRIRTLKNSKCPSCSRNKNKNQIYFKF